MRSVYHGILKMIMPDPKQELRVQIKQARVALSARERQASSAAIVNHLQELIDWSSVKTLHCYEPIMRLGEVDVSGLISALQAEQPHTRLYTSRQINGVWRIVSWHDDLPVAEPIFDVIIVPMLGFDSKLHRLGYGGGYYDRFLATQHAAQKVGVCFESGKIKPIPAESHDIRLNVIVTEERVYQG